MVHKIGVVVPTFNRKRLLVKALQSLVDQSYDNWKAIVVDDCSSEDIKGHLDACGLLKDDRIEYYRMDRNSGINAVRNYGLEILADKGEIDKVTFLDDDDYFLPHYFEDALRIMERENTQWLISKCIDPSGNEITKYFTAEKHVDYMDYWTGAKLTGDAAMMIDWEAVGDLRFTTEYRSGYEWYLFLHLAKRTSMYLSKMHSKVVVYQDNGMSKGERSPERTILQYRKRVLRELGYDYYLYVAKKHQAKYRENKNIRSLLKFWVYRMLIKRGR